MAVMWGRIGLVILILAGIVAYATDFRGVQEDVAVWWAGTPAEEKPAVETQTTYTIVVNGEEMQTTTEPNPNKYLKGEDGKYRLRKADNTTDTKDDSNYAAIKKAALSEMTTFSVRDISEWERNGIPYKLQVKLDGKNIDPRVFVREGRNTESRRKIDDTAYETYHQAVVDESPEVSNNKFVWTSMTGLDSQVKALRFYFEDTTNSNRNAELVVTVDADSNDGFRPVEQNNDNLRDLIPWDDMVIVQAKESLPTLVKQPSDQPPKNESKGSDNSQDNSQETGGYTGQPIG